MKHRHSIFRIFVTVAEHPTLCAAAAALEMSQPSVSESLKRLEKQLGAKLIKFETNKPLQLTEVGRLIYEDALTIERLQHTGMCRIESIISQQRKTLRIGTGHAWWPLFMYDAITHYRDLHQSLIVDIAIGNNLRLMDALIAGSLDLFIGHEINGLARNNAVRFIPLFRTHDSFFAREDHPLASRARIELSDVVDYPLVELTPEESRYHNLVKSPYFETDPTVAELGKVSNIMHMLDPHNRINVPVDAKPVEALWKTNSMMVALDLITSSDAILMPFPTPMGQFLTDRQVKPLNVLRNTVVSSVGIYTFADRLDIEHIKSLREIIESRVRELRLTGVK